MNSDFARKQVVFREFRRVYCASVVKKTHKNTDKSGLYTISNTPTFAPEF
jgi:hypothetical protein